MTWKSELSELIRKQWAIGEQFESVDVYRFESHFAKLYPRNNTIRHKIRQTLQFLARDGEVKFVNNFGLYRRLK